MSQTGSLNFGRMSTGVFGLPMPASGASSFSFDDSSMVWPKPASGGFEFTTQSSLFGGSFQQHSQPASGASFSPAFGAPSSSSGGSSIHVQKPASGGFGSTTQSSPFGISFQQQPQSFGASTTPAFGATSTPVFGVTSTPAFGNTGSAFGTSVFGSSKPDVGAANTPAFGASSAPAYGQSQPAFGASSIPAFGASGTTAFGAASTAAFGATSTPAFGATSTPAFGNTGSAFGTSVFGSSKPHFDAVNTPAFGASSAPTYGKSQPDFGASSIPAFGASSTPAFGETSMPAFGNTCSASGTSVFGSSTPDFGAANTPAFGASSAPAYGQSQPAFGASSIPAFGASGTAAFGATSTPAFGATRTPVFGNTGAASGTSVFGSSTPDFGAANTPAFGASGAPAYGQSQPVFGASSIPAFGALSTPAFGAIRTPTFCNTGSAFGTSVSGSSTPDFGASSGPAFGQSTSAFGSSPFGAVHFPFGAQTSAPPFWSHGFGQPSIRNPLHEGTRVITYAQTTDDYNNSVSPTGKLKSISAMPAYRHKSHEELRWEDYKLGDKGNVLFHYPPEFWKAAFCYSAFGASFVSKSLFGSTTSGCPFGRPSSSTFGTSTPIFGTKAQGTASAFGTGFNNGSTQSSPLFQSPTPTPGQTSSLFGPAAPSSGQSTPPLGGNLHLNTPSFLSTSSMGVDQKTFSLSTPFQSTQPTQNTGGFSFAPPTGSGGTSSVFGQDTSRQPFRSQGPIFSQQSVTSPFGTSPATPVDEKPSPTRKSCLLNSQKRVAKKTPFKKVSFSDEMTTSTTPVFGQLPFGSQQRAGTRVTLYAKTMHETGGDELVSISAMHAYKEKSHEELRWEDYLVGDKGGIRCGFYMNNIQPNPFVPTSTFVFGTQAQGTGSSFGSTPLFQSTAPAFGQTSSPLGQHVLVIHQHFYTNHTG